MREVKASIYKDGPKGRVVIFVDTDVDMSDWPIEIRVYDSDKEDDVPDHTKYTVSVRKWWMS